MVITMLPDMIGNLNYAMCRERVILKEVIKGLECFANIRKLNS